MNWQTVTLDSIKAPRPYAFVGGPFGSNLSTRHYVDEGVPVIRGNNLPADALFRDDNFVFVSEQKADELQSNTAYPGDIVFTQRGTLGQVGVIPNDSQFQRYVISQSQMKLTVDPRVADAKFVYYCFRDPENVQRIINRALTSGVPHINLGILRGFEIRIPDVAYQRRVADTLSAYDGLIENNRRRMVLLEEFASNLYREWFVRLRFPGHEHTTIVNGIPDGWTIGKVADFFDTTSGGTPSRANPEFYTGDINWVKTQELNDEFIFETQERITEVALARSSAKLFPQDTLIVSMYGGSNIGRTGILAQPAATNQACCALWPKNSRVHYSYAALYFRDQREGLIALAQGAAQTNVNQQLVRNLPFRVATPSVMSSFMASIIPSFEQRRTLKRLNQRLTEARDLLLPRLMTGEIIV